MKQKTENDNTTKYFLMKFKLFQNPNLGEGKVLLVQCSIRQGGKFEQLKIRAQFFLSRKQEDRSLFPEIRDANFEKNVIFTWIIKDGFG
ncbi:hypothetical protein BKP35_10590 [Anaerobacillus arseniciselenatis]|uniref:Uncharacterized protein n=1 Tax=Anaerobacillus arseniciselenatis TaxID=85682 RepID=A0A1S2LJS9_9BACI|nr:hypothetical protein BKP35_10590 [Anaerobacillus arseniciselenatis]